MIFNSIEFILFAILFFVGWSIVKKEKNLRWGFITAMSFVFYGWWDWRFLFLIVGSGLIDYVAALYIQKKPNYKKAILIISLFGNLGSLSIFKYSVFFADIIEDCFHLMNLNVHLHDNIPAFALILPVGISFYTFQSMSYTIDVYRGRLEPTKNILLFFSYLSMFPQLVAGPIVRAKDLLFQLSHDRFVSDLQKWNALKLIAFGLFQKVVIADNLSFFIDSAFEGKSHFDGSLYWWSIMVAFSFQIYCDFSGYSLMARGLAKYMGYHFKINFNHPYLARSLRDFWNRWHISLSTWFRDYVYIPLGGSRNGIFVGIITLWITMTLSGLWHGAKYTFIIWAAIHAFFLMIERLTKWNLHMKSNYFAAIIIPIIFIQVLIGWVYFRSDTIVQANTIVKKLFIFEPTDLKFFNVYFNSLFFLFLAIMIEILIWFRKNKISVALFYKRYNFDILLVSLAIVAALFFRGEGKQFIYFQF